MNCTHDNPCSDREPSTCDNRECPSHAVHRSSRSACSAQRFTVDGRRPKWRVHGYGRIMATCTIATDAFDIADALNASKQNSELGRTDQEEEGI